MNDSNLWKVLAALPAVALWLGLFLYLLRVERIVKEAEKE